ncbi:MAG: hypothetical protein LKM31_18040 [Sphingobium sp.]|jgi:hypothetical protein|nr:hypothetical protein [Sphingobium sp.]
MTVAFKGAGDIILADRRKRHGHLGQSHLAARSAWPRGRPAARRSISPPNARTGDFVRALIADIKPPA